MFVGLNWRGAGAPGFTLLSRRESRNYLAQRALLQACKNNALQTTSTHSRAISMCLRWAKLLFKKITTPLSWATSWHLLRLGLQLAQLPIPPLSLTLAPTSQRVISHCLPLTRVRCYNLGHKLPQRFLLCWWLSQLANCMSSSTYLACKVAKKPASLGPLAELRYVLFDLKA